MTCLTNNPSKNDYVYHPLGKRESSVHVISIATGIHQHAIRELMLDQKQYCQSSRLTRHQERWQSKQQRPCQCSQHCSSSRARSRSSCSLWDHGVEGSAAFECGQDNCRSIIFLHTHSWSSHSLRQCFCVSFDGLLSQKFDSMDWAIQSARRKKKSKLYASAVLSRCVSLFRAGNHSHTLMRRPYMTCFLQSCRPIPQPLHTFSFISPDPSKPWHLSRSFLYPGISQILPHVV